MEKTGKVEKNEEKPENGVQRALVVFEQSKLSRRRGRSYGWANDALQKTKDDGSRTYEDEDEEELIASYERRRRLAYIEMRGCGA